MRLSITVPFDPSAFAQLSVELQRAIRFALGRAAIRIQSECKDIPPARTGRLRQSFKTGVTGDMIEMSWSAPYAEVVDIGATPHTISGNLVFKDSRTGDWVRKSSVNHPGYSGRFYRMEVGAKAMAILNEEMALAIGRIRTVAA